MLERKQQKFVHEQPRIRARASRPCPACRETKEKKTCMLTRTGLLHGRSQPNRSRTDTDAYRSLYMYISAGRALASHDGGTSMYDTSWALSPNRCTYPKVRCIAAACEPAQKGSFSACAQDQRMRLKSAQQSVVSVCRRVGKVMPSKNGTAADCKAWSKTCYLAEDLSARENKAFETPQRDNIVGEADFEGDINIYCHFFNLSALSPATFGRRTARDGFPSSNLQQERGEDSQDGAY